MAFGFPARASDSRAYPFEQYQLAMAARSAFDSLGWTYQALADNAFTAQTSINLMSWGEHLSVRIHPNGLVQAESRCAMPLQCFDWGKNGENVRTFFQRLEAIAQTQLRN